ncbi:hypothetical protein HDU78_003094 [Chytriomyces hyalinus]|nr:hypothetical protein HDU78_003094 [Chytriomyces hyalinus]
MDQNGDNGKIIARPKKAVSGVEKRRATFQADLLRKYQLFKPEAKKVPLKELREGKANGIRMINWPSSVTRMSNFNEKELEILEQHSVSLVESTDRADSVDGIGHGMPVGENAQQESTHVEDQENISGQWMGSHLAAGEKQVLDVAMSFDFARLETPASDGTEHMHQSTMGLNGADLDALDTAWCAI